MIDNRDFLSRSQIMIVDDTIENLKLLAKILGDAGYHVRPANTGELALSSIEKLAPDLILLDVLMPGMDGYTLCEKLKSDPDTCEIPIIFISALDDSRDRVRGFQAGAVDFITKPFEPLEILARVKIHVSLRLLQLSQQENNRVLKKEIRKRIATEQILYAEKERLRITLKSIGDGIICTDENGNVSIINQAAKTMTGWEEDSAIGQPFDKVFHIINSKSRIVCENPIHKVLSNGLTIGLANHTSLISKDGTERPIFDSAAPIMSETGAVSGVVLTFMDMTESRNAEIALGKSEERYKSIFEQAAVGICNTSLDGRFLRANQKFCDILGYSLDELLVKSFSDLTHPDDLHVSLNLSSQLKNEIISSMTLEKRYVKKNGEIVWANLSAALIKDINGVPIYFNTIINDISDRKHSEQALILSEARLKRAQSIVHAGNWEMNLSENQVLVSDEVFVIFGLEKTSSYITIQDLEKVVGRNDLTRMNNAQNDFIQFNKEYDLAFHCIRNNDGEERVIHSTAVMEYDNKNNPIKILGVMQDITDLTKSEIEKQQFVTLLTASEERYKSMFEQAPIGIALSDSITGRFLKTNAKFVEIAGRSAEVLTSIDWMSITHPDDVQSDLDKMSCMNTGKTNGFSMIKRYIRPDSSIVWIDMTIAPLYIDNEELCNLCMVLDITERKQKEQKIEYLNFHDILTDLYNRAFFEEEAKRLDSEKYLPLAIIEGDINGLKLINDAMGHAEGDRLLIETAKILKASCRKSDIVARVGGDEFSILLPNISSEEVQDIINRIYLACNEYNQKTKPDTKYLSLSLGYATKFDSSEELDDIIKTADSYMYKRKLLEHNSFHSSFISSIKLALSEKNHETEEHAERLVELSKMLGEELGLTDQQMNELELLSALHDIGKISINDYILNKPDKLNEAEWAEMRKHPEIGYRIAMASPDLARVAECILCHHERWDGKGYPLGIIEENIPLISRIIAVVDSYDAMTQDRPYRKAMSEQHAINEIENNKGTQFDPKIANVFLQLLHNKNAAINQTQ